MNPDRLARARELVQSSLDSHRIAIDSPDDLEEATDEFHLLCIQEYEEILAILSEIEEYLWPQLWLYQND